MRAMRWIGVGLLWIVQILAAAAFILIGVAKFLDPAWARNFARWGYPGGFYMVIGVLELLGGVLLLVPRLTTYAAALLGTIMVGATITHLRFGELRRVTAPLVLLAIMILLGVVRRRAALRLRTRGLSSPLEPV